MVMTISLNIVNMFNGIKEHLFYLYFLLFFHSPAGLECRGYIPDFQNIIDRMI